MTNVCISPIVRSAFILVHNSSVSNGILIFAKKFPTLRVELDS